MVQLHWLKRLALPGALATLLALTPACNRDSSEQSTLVPTEPCVPAQNGVPSTTHDEATGCPTEVELRIRPFTKGTFQPQTTNAARAKGDAKACCYSYATIGNR